MRKILTILLFIPIFLTAQNKVWYKSEAFSVRVPEQKWSDWEDSNLDLMFNYEDKKIFIFSRFLQSYTYDSVEVQTNKDCKVFYFSCKDTRDVKCSIEVWNYNNSSLYVKILYKNIEYKYMLSPIGYDYNTPRTPHTYIDTIKTNTDIFHLVS